MSGLKRALAIVVFCGVLAPPSALAEEMWSVQSTPNSGGSSDYNRLFQVGCGSGGARITTSPLPQDLAACTAVGTRTSAGVDYPVALRWDGVSWKSQTPLQKSGATHTRLFGVDCAIAYQCIAVGNSQVSGSGTVTLGEKWTESGWVIQATPVPSGATSSQLTKVDCNSAYECTAVGWAVVSGVKKAIAEKWTKDTWSLYTIPVPSGATSSQLDGISCRWSNYCVAVGRYTTSTGATKSLAMFWNGSSWSLQALTDPTGAVQTTLLDVDCLGESPTVCTAVGGWKNSAYNQFTLAYRFNGSTWTLQSTPNPSGSIASIFQDVSCKTTTSCAAVGSWVSGTGGSNQTLAEDWNGNAWSIQSTPNVSGMPFNAFFGVACRPQGCLGVGYSNNSSGVSRTLSELRAAPSKTHLTYSIGIPPAGLPEGWENAVRAAMTVWSQWTPLTFSQVTPGPNKADLEFNWMYEAGNGQEFDGPGGKVVRAYGPLESLPGDIYLDQSESWVTYPASGSVSITPVLENAIEHALGISGSTLYETDTSGGNGLTMAQIEAGVARYGSHPSQRRYFLKNSNTEGVPDIVFESPADGPDSEFSGDWNGDGYDTIGWFEQHSFLCDPPRDEELCQDQVWLYSDPHTSGTNTPHLWTSYYTEFFNQTYDWFAGDWDGGGNETFGYYEGEFTLLEEYSGVQYHFDFGNDGDIPLVGDWNGDGIDTIGMYRRSNATFYLRNTNSSGNADIVIPSYAIEGDQPVVGDWNGDGVDTIGIYRPSYGQWRLNDQNENNAPEHVFFYGNVGGWVRVVGDWNGDGIDTPGFAQD
jgi:matrixin